MRSSFEFETALATMRHDFDSAFAEPSMGRSAQVDVLALRLGGDPYVVRLAEVAALHVGRRIVPLPSPVVELLGVTGLRGRTLPVFDLGVILGYAPAEGPRWLLVARGPLPVAFAFAAFDGHVQWPEGAFSTAGDERPRAHVGGAVRTASGARSVLELASVVDALSRRVAGLAPPVPREGAL